MPESNNGYAVTAILAAFATGALVGAGVAILLAPRSGKETRDLLCRKTHDIKDTADDAIEKGKQLVGEMKQKAGELYDKGKDAIKEARESASRSA